MMTRDEMISVGTFAAIGMLFSEAVRLNSVVALDDAIKAARVRVVERADFEQRITLAEEVVKYWDKEIGQ